MGIILILILKKRNQQRDGEHCTICTGKGLSFLVMLACLTVDMATVNFNLDIRCMWLLDCILEEKAPLFFD